MNNLFESRSRELIRLLRNPWSYPMSKITSDGSDDVDRSVMEVKAYRLRGKMRRHYSYAIPNEAAINLLVEESPIVEIGAGSGYWAMLVEEEGGEIVCFDKYPNGDNEYVTNFFSTDIMEGDENAVKDYPDHTLFMCWPNDFNSEEGWSDKALENYLDAGGEKLALISEGKYGAAGSDRLFEMIQSEMYEEKMIRIPQFPRLHDRLELYCVRGCVKGL